MNIPFFKKNSDYTAEEAMELLKHCKIKFFPPMTGIYYPGDLNHDFYFILRGKVIVGVNENE